MIDLNTIISNALTAAVTSAVAPLNERIAMLEKNEEYLVKRIAALEGVDHERQHAMTARWFGGAREEIDALTTRVVALENNPAQGVDTQATPVIDEARMVEALNSQEWFWEKLQNRIDAATEQAVDNHCENYDHDDYDSIVSKVEDMPDFDDYVTRDSVREEIEDVLNNATLSLSI